MSDGFVTAGAREWLDKLRIPLLLFAMLILYAGGQFDELRPWLARAVVFGVPLVAVVYTSVGLFDTHPLLKHLGLGLALLSLLAAFWVGVGLFQPAAPLAKLSLSLREPVSAELRPGQQELGLVIHGKVLREEKAHAVIVVRRGASEQRLEHTFNQPAPPSGPGGRSAPVSRGAWRERLELAEAGPVVLELTEVEGLVTPVAAELLPPAAYPMLPKFAVVLLTLVAVVIQALVARRGIRARLATGVAVALAFAAYAPSLVDPRKPHDAVFSLLVVALLAAACGLLLGHIATRISKRPSVKPTIKRAA